MSELIKNSNFDEFYLALIRVLSIVSFFKDKDKYNLTIHRIALFDFYCQFPVTTIECNEQDNDFSEKYSYYHWKPNYQLYNATISILVSKGLIDRNDIDDKKCYKITDIGLQALKNMKCLYIDKLMSTGIYIVSTLTKLSDKKIDEDIIKKSCLLKEEGVLNE